MQLQSLCAENVNNIRYIYRNVLINDINIVMQQVYNFSKIHVRKEYFFSNCFLLCNTWVWITMCSLVGFNIAFYRVQAGYISYYLLPLGVEDICR